MIRNLKTLCFFKNCKFHSGFNKSKFTSLLVLQNVSLINSNNGIKIWINSTYKFWMYVGRYEIVGCKALSFIWRSQLLTKDLIIKHFQVSQCQVILTVFLFTFWQTYLLNIKKLSPLSKKCIYYGLIFPFITY